ncbi:MAG: hypothetical protein HFH84_01070 [Lachnospiraceae bacterium]|nr:hypothetical protein [Lachnospiraceae bacterium]
MDEVAEVISNRVRLYRDEGKRVLHVRNRNQTVFIPMRKIEKLSKRS